MSFEDGSLGAVPTGWQSNADQAGQLCQITEASFFPRGSVEGQRAVIMTNDGAPQIYLRQSMLMVVPVGDAFGFAGVAAGAPGSGGVDTLRVRILEYDDAAVVDETEVFVTPGEGVWTPFFVKHTRSDPASDSFQIRMSLDGVATAGGVYVDYTHAGRLLDFETCRFETFETQRDFRSVLNEGAGTYEAVKLGSSRTRVRSKLVRMTEGEAFERDWQDFLGYSELHNPFAFWRDRDVSLNSGGHFGTCLLTGGFGQAFLRGPSMAYNATLEFVAPLEWVQQVPA